MFNPYLLREKEYPLLALQREAERLRQQGRDIINLTIGDPKDVTYSDVSDSTIAYLSQHKVSQYPKPAGEPELLTAISSWAKRDYNIELSPTTHILSCNGTKEAIFLLPLCFDWSDGKKIFISSLSYPVYAASTGLQGINLEVLPVSKQSDFLPDLDKITEEQWATCRLFWINSPHNPTTTVAERVYFQKLINLAEQYGFFICSDECYNDLYETDKPTSCLDFSESDRWIVFRSLSKRSHMTGYRSGAVISKNDEFIRLFKKCRAPIGVGTPTFIQKGAISAWNDDVHVLKHREHYQKKRQLLKQALLSKGFEIYGGDAGFYFWFSHPNLLTSEDLSRSFLNADLLITPGTVFGSDGEGFARMVFCVRDDECDKVRNRIEKMYIN